MQLMLYSVTPSVSSVKLGVNLETSQQHLQPADEGGDKNSSPACHSTMPVWLY